MKKREAILYIDDEKENLSSFRLLFGDVYEIFLANTIEQMHNILSETEIKVLISDQKMPEKTGLELCEEIKQSYPDIILMITTAYSDLNVAIEAVNQGGIFHFMLKPWNNNEVVLIINKALDKYHLQYENKQLLNDLKYKNEELQAYTEELLATTNALKENNEELEISKEKAEESDKLKTAFLSNMSHEIRTPMNGIMGFSEILVKPDINDEQKEQYKEIIIKSCNQLLNIVNDILDIAKIEAGQVKTKEKEVFLQDYCLNIINLHQKEAKRKNIELKTCDESFCQMYKTLCPKVLIDEKKLSQIINKLLNNALKFTKEGTIKLLCCIKNDQIEFSVSDTGIGIPTKLHEKIFDPFRQAELTTTRIYGGTGLGLSICKGLVEQMNGKIRVKSELGKGATFFVTIPYKPINSEIEKIKSDIQIIDNQDKYIILIVEDEEVNNLYFEAILENEIEFNCEILHAKDGKEAVDICKNKKEIDLILMDLKMPVMSGYEATKQIKEFSPDLPIVAQTEHPAREEKEQALSAGCDDFISKPISEETFNKIIKKYLKSNN